MDTRWLSEDERHAWIRLAAVVELLPRELDAQLQRDEQLSHFDYFSLAMLSEAPARRLRLTALAAMTNATLPRLSRVMSRLEAEGWVQREPCPGDKRAVNLVLTEAGWEKVVHAAPGHVGTVRSLVIDVLTPEQIAQLSEVLDRVLAVLDPEQRVMASALRPSGT
ncbi:DNA-binding MarR family transcriptional regulator [Friedmanniella endophytica]|uniref:DNA-binding MarR family transcriptional regulator n=1 Tax=Microlunatus kandeliicorticis TaxID=1759536 RepID=A0A7W3P5C6_9ACTN|nr:MarR family transcriptional regulator [Microlunatus kandeliicorticis]MBA8793740.1 DNA-binding MarR family transcriptional regulator [Microlunatus kandeliicorticis]